MKSMANDLGINITSDVECIFRISRCSTDK